MGGGRQGIDHRLRREGREDGIEEPPRVVEEAGFDECEDHSGERSEAGAEAQIGLRPGEELEGDLRVGSGVGENSADEVVGGSGFGEEGGLRQEEGDPVVAVEEKGRYLVGEGSFLEVGPPFGGGREGGEGEGDAGKMEEEFEEH